MSSGHGTTGYCSRCGQEFVTCSLRIDPITDRPVCRQCYYDSRTEDVSFDALQELDEMAED